jgi:hypothetical protein
MMLSLPVAGYELDEKEYESKDILDWILHYDFTKDRVGYILECDIDPPDNKEFFNGYLLFHEKIDSKLEATLLPKKTLSCSYRVSSSTQLSSLPK